ncbi:hypothetical protein G6F62_003265 [Rhizopus arrhizus]|uniref:Regulator of G protein signaling superfamily n=1 Tax=Rhizopus oryzae TaxID=64495 RepID=A0A9P6XCM0_RHIOR|nr:hypothetical protein G6F23_004321 [Rhizopus arrhizus]KAG0759476.1 hypothetical protein G6F24_009036 [Rhizopus arrhizus]KAG0791331.1 hypothetical protein G6F21_005158 [Rhizopus arrhizus]KAG0800081.1 hypothetical protein G6F22_002589 [Rhizopus arrhizus]KAG0809811.1 hypothetical protein G6F20_008470 [Rhizopus arrhizus]
MPKTLSSSFATYTTMMRITKKGRPYTKDLYDMFSAVLLQTNLTDHRSLFRTYPYTFTTEEAVKVMSSLKFIHVLRQPDPSNPSHQIATRTTTTFSMDATTAKNMLQFFLFARLIQNATDSTNWTVKDKGFWCPTLKGKHVLEEFADYTQVEMTDNLIAALNAPYMSPSVSGSTGGRIITLDRLTDHDDQITFSRANMTVAFKAMLSSLSMDALILDDVGGIERKNLAQYQHTFLAVHCVEWLADRLTVMSREEAETIAAEFVLFGWIALVLDKSDKSITTKDEGVSFKTTRSATYYVTERGYIAAGWKIPKEEIIQPTSDLSFHSETSSQTTTSSNHSNKNAKHKPIQPSESHIKFHSPEQREDLSVAEEMKRVDSGTSLVEQLANASLSKDVSALPPDTPIRPPSMSFTDSSMSHGSTSSANKDSSHYYTRLYNILETPLLRMYFRDFLKSNYCAENINFWVDHDRLVRNSFKSETTAEQLADCYSIYESYLSPNAEEDVNIDHTLRQEIISYVQNVFVPVPHPPRNDKIPYFTTPILHHKPANPSDRFLLLPPQATVKQRTIIIRGVSPDRCLIKLLSMLGRVNEHVCKMMAEDSVPKFVKTSRYKELQQHQQPKQNVIVSHEQTTEEDQDDLLMALSSTPPSRVSIEDQGQEIQIP